MSKLKIFLFSWYSILFSATTLAVELDHAYLENLAKNYVQQQIAIPKDGKLKIQTVAIDPRIKITACNQPLQLNIPENHNSRNINVKISCLDDKPWKIFIPVKVSITIPVVIAKQYIAKGSLLDNSNLAVVLKDSLQTRGEFYNSIEQVENNKALKSLPKGRIVSPNNICLVCKGENVTINATTSGLSIQTAGIALNNGVLNEIIKVKNVRSGRIISGQIKAANYVEIH